MARADQLQQGSGGGRCRRPRGGPRADRRWGAPPSLEAAARPARDGDQAPVEPGSWPAPGRSTSNNQLASRCCWRWGKLQPLGQPPADRLAPATEPDAGEGPKRPCPAQRRRQWGGPGLEPAIEAGPRAAPIRNAARAGAATAPAQQQLRSGGKAGARAAVQGGILALAPRPGPGHQGDLRLAPGSRARRTPRRDGIAGRRKSAGPGRRARCRVQEAQLPVGPGRPARWGSSRTSEASQKICPAAIRRWNRSELFSGLGGPAPRAMALDAEVAAGPESSSRRPACTAGSPVAATDSGFRRAVARSIQQWALRQLQLHFDVAVGPVFLKLSARPAELPAKACPAAGRLRVNNLQHREFAPSQPSTTRSRSVTARARGRGARYAAADPARASHRAQRSPAAAFAAARPQRKGGNAGNLHGVGGPVAVE